MAEHGNDERSDQGRQIYVGDKGHRYVKADELLKDPNVKRRLKRADQLASKLGLKGKRDT